MNILKQMKNKVMQKIYRKMLKKWYFAMTSDGQTRQVCLSFSNVRWGIHCKDKYD